MRIARVVACAAAVIAAGLVAGVARPSAAPLGAAPACPVFPATNVWNKPVDGLPVAANSDTMIDAIGRGTGMHPDFGSYAGYGIPITVVPGTQRRVKVAFTWPRESNPGPYPIPAKPKIEAGSDRHILMVDKDHCKLYELFAARHTSTGWHAGSGAIWDMRSDALRPDGWTSADAAGLPILPGLVRGSEVTSGLIDHALRFTVPSTCAGHIYPARHDAGSGSCASRPPMGLRVRLKASFDLSQLSPQARVIGQALKTYGMILADNGSPWYVSGYSSSVFDDDDLRTLNRIHGDDLEVVDTTGFVNG
jgi:hypothetical protein